MLICKNKNKNKKGCIVMYDADLRGTNFGGKKFPVVTRGMGKTQSCANFRSDGGIPT